MIVKYKSYIREGLIAWAIGDLALIAMAAFDVPFKYAPLTFVPLGFVAFVAMVEDSITELDSRPHRGKS